MCQFASFKFRPCGDVPVVVADPNSHGETEKALKLPPDAGADSWHDGHYLPDGTVECRGVEGDTLTPMQCESAIRARWPTFTAFWGWAMRQPGCKALTTLDLRDTKVSDLAPLAGCKALTMLYLCGTKVSEKQVAALRVALPKCKVWT